MVGYKTQSTSEKDFVTAGFVVVCRISDDGTGQGSANVSNWRPLFF